MVADGLAGLIRTIPGYPKPGIQFRDITTLLLDPAGLSGSIDQLSAALADLKPDLIAGIEARGFIFGTGVAQALGCGLLLIRKKNKLPGAVLGVNYALEYGQDRIEMHADACPPGARVVIVDDLIATGGTAIATAQLLRQAGAEVAGAGFVIDLPDLGGAARLRAGGVRVQTLLEFAGD
ncbi:adenine phosphoribosyltransferase [Glacieibacterium frigidum]|uniref:Adenine phosphoribosyltransferase n=1 Tax=Glacieibacterium frigidum TaxID=2593303 RepID=A0A552U6Z6_9SPHN|nr:adenine phosphoribosyltransferase [Glacieibacterium frigidum]TRW13993.1 adenine phosphoribosyltransferase [Glacieibacterium frigidum]